MVEAVKTGPVSTVPQFNPMPIVQGLLLTYAQGVQCVISKMSASRYPNANKMQAAATNGIEAVLGLAVTLNSQGQQQDNNLLSSLITAVQQAQPAQVAAEPVVQPKDDARLTRVETKIHDVNGKLDLIIKELGQPVVTQ
tara:strand:- start:106 stop:522 length:417 start_codon:yes stop_codon:yes gene_type:complete